jgi:hypothetical protein
MALSRLCNIFASTVVKSFLEAAAFFCRAAAGWHNGINCLYYFFGAGCTAFQEG